MKPRDHAALRPLAFYLPQYHPIPENDAWWGEGFTDWTNVRKARPLFAGHHQPHVPGRLGYYDLRDPEARAAQAELARACGIHGFCYYYYWFNGRRLLETPLQQVLASGRPDFPFCVCWANENWTRRWDGQEEQVLLAQRYAREDDLALIDGLLPAFRDERYIRVGGGPLLLVYRTHLLPDPRRTAETWRAAARRAGVGELYLVRVESHMDGDELDPAAIGFDAAVEFAPNWAGLGAPVTASVGVFPESRAADPRVYDYERALVAALASRTPPYRRFRGVFPGWDNTARRRHGPTLFVNSSPERYAFWLAEAARRTLADFSGDERLLFVNAWNEWAEGCHLEPDERHGERYLEATRRALRLAADVHAAEQAVGAGGAGGVLPFAPERWGEAVAALYGDREGLGDGERRALAALAPALLCASGPVLDEGLGRLRDSVREAEGRLEAQEHVVRSVLGSASWRLTAPLRRVHAGLRRIVSGSRDGG